MLTPATLHARIARHQPRHFPWTRRLAQAAVAVVLAEDAQGVSVLLMRRAQRQGDPWSGHMSFPGGRVQGNDAGLRMTAMRETCEEVGLSLSPAQYLGQLSAVVTRRHERPTPMIVTPCVFRSPRNVPLSLGHEGVEALWVPLAFLADPCNRRQMRWRALGVNWRMPCYDYEGRRIWGLTLQMLDELMRLYRGR